MGPIRPLDYSVSCHINLIYLEWLWSFLDYYCCAYYLFLENICTFIPARDFCVPGWLRTLLWSNFTDLICTDYFFFKFQVYSATDILLCTASILNITLISLDRYFSITRALEYLQFRTANSVTTMICSVWFLSAMISVAPLIYKPWNFPFTQPKNDEIFLQTDDILTLGNRSRILSEYRCQVRRDILYKSF